MAIEQYQPCEDPAELARRLRKPTRERFSGRRDLDSRLAILDAASLLEKIANSRIVEIGGEG